MDTDPTVSFASADWIRQPQPLDPFHQLGGVLSAKQQNAEFLDYTNTWLVTTNIDYRPPVDQIAIPTAYSVNQRPAYLEVPGQLPTRCQLQNQAQIRSAANALDPVQGIVALANDQASASSTFPQQAQTGSPMQNAAAPSSPTFEQQAQAWLAGSPSAASPSGPMLVTPTPAAASHNSSGLVIGIVALIVLILLLILAQRRHV